MTTTVRRSGRARKARWRPEPVHVLLAIAWLVVLGLGALLSGGSTDERVLSAEAFGARPDDGLDDGPALRAALTAADGAAGGAVVSLAPGRYDVDSASTSGPYLMVDDAERLRILGVGAEIEFGRPERDGLAVIGSSGVVVDGLTFDFEVPPFAQGVVVAIDEAGNTVDVAVAEGFPGLDSTWFDDVEWVTRHDAASGRLITDPTDLIPLDTEPVHVTARTWRLRIVPGEVSLAIGDGVVVPIRGLGSAIVVSASPDTSLRDVTVHSAPGSAIAALDSPGLVVSGSEVGIRAGSERWISASGDGVHHSGGGDGPVIRGNRFTGMLDDGVNLYSVPGVVRVAVATDGAGGRSGLEVDRPFAIEEGDRVQVLDAVDGVVRNEGRIVTSEPMEAARWRLTISLDGDRDTSVQPGDQLYVVDDVATGFEISGNLFADHRSRGVVVRGRAGRIEANRFERLPAGVVVANEPDWPEGNVPSQIDVVGNRFVDVAALPGGSAAVVVRATRLGDLVARRPLIHDVRITDNVMTGAGPAVLVGAARDVTIDGNVVRRRPGTDAGVAMSPVVVAELAPRARVRDLTVSGLPADQAACAREPDDLIVGVDDVAGLSVDRSC